MQEIKDFRLYYNHTIHPELLRMESRRRRLLFLFFSAVFLIFVLLGVGIYIDILPVTLFLLIPVGFYFGYISFRIKKFISRFKPQVISLILDFIDDSINYGQLKYNAKKSISIDDFKNSQIFDTPNLFQGEDYISGKIGELEFEMSEVFATNTNVNKLINHIFHGVFLHCTIPSNIGSVLIVPSANRQFMVKSIQKFCSKGRINVTDQIDNPIFKKLFLVYADDDADLSYLLSPRIQDALVNFRNIQKKDIFVSIIETKIAIAISESEDILEPFILQTNLKFDLIKAFYENISTMVNMINAFDENI